MPKSKKPRKANNFHRRILRASRYDANKCCLCHWVEAFGDEFGYTAHGPFEDAHNQALMKARVAREETWFINFIACFVTEEGDYYEEHATTNSIGPLVLSKKPEWLAELLNTGLQQVKAAGNPKHYIDTVVSFHPCTADTTYKFDNDAWVKKQTAWRRTQIIKQLKQYPNWMKSSDAERIN